MSASGVEISALKQTTAMARITPAAAGESST
jgi:hypothetical protein